MKWTELTPSRHQLAISGQVSDAITNQAIAGALVELKGSKDFQKWLDLKALQYGDRWKTLSRRPDRTYTAPDGYFYFIDLPAGDYQLQVSLPGAGTRFGTTETDVVLTEQDNSLLPKTIDLSLSPTVLKGAITSVVTPNSLLDSGREGQPANHQSQPIRLAKIQLEGTGVSVWSDAQGKYELVGLEASNHRVTVSAQDYAPESQPIILKPGETNSLDFQLQKTTSKDLSLNSKESL